MAAAGEIIAPDVASTVPDTPPQRIAQVKVGTAVMTFPHLPLAVNLKTLPSCIKLAGMVTFGKMIVSVVVVFTAVPSAVAQESASDQYCLLIYLLYHYRKAVETRGTRFRGIFLPSLSVRCPQGSIWAPSFHSGGQSSS